ncbi:MAG: NADH-quinone oxidoreductase subunit NuoB [Candidatus Omnitrophica bacterium]|nr:NADH-quinone oxidoreductase subunit NuoB [Candidatus Omnitrophota bacterium]
MSLKLKALTKSIWVYHLCAGGSCNNCDIEILDLLTPRYDVERFGIMLVGSIKHADAILVTGSLTRKAVECVKRVYEQAAKPCVVIAIGACACGQGMFANGPNTPDPVDSVLPVDIYIPGCPPKPEAMILGIVKLIGKLRGKK